MLGVYYEEESKLSGVNVYNIFNRKITIIQKEGEDVDKKNNEERSSSDESSSSEESSSSSVRIYWI